MSLIPSWAPNLHPLVIHFPIVLVMTAAVVDLVDVVFERSPWLRAATTTLYVAGAVSTVVAFLTGVQAGSTVLVPGMAYPVLTAHRQWALATMACCIVVAVLRLAMLRGDGARSRPRRVAAARHRPRRSRPDSADRRARRAAGLRVRHGCHRTIGQRTLEPLETSHAADGVPVREVRPLSVDVVSAPETPSRSIALECVCTSTAPAPVNEADTRPLAVLARRPPRRLRAVIALLDVEMRTIPSTPSTVTAPEPVSTSADPAERSSRSRSIGSGPRRGRRGRACRSRRNR